MRSGFRLGRVAQTHLVVDWSWLFVALLLTWSLTDVFARWHPDWSAARSVSVAGCATLLFFASILAHELAHAAVGRALGNPSRRVTLWLFGGVSEMERPPRSPGEEFLTAVAGPLTSLGLGALFLGLGALGVSRVDRLMTDSKEIFAALGPVSTLLLWLGPVNLGLGLFNLLPAYPLDGGRVLRAALWASSGDLRRATRQASGVGQAVAWAFIVAGVAMAFGARLPYFGTGFFGGLWLSFIGWFLFRAASRSWERAVVADVLGDVSVARLMRRTGPSATPDLTVNRFVNEWLLPSDERAWPVLAGDAFLGMVCLADVRKVPRAAWDEVTLGQILTPAAALVTAAPDDAVTDALDKLARRDVAQLPVVAQGRLVGMLMLRDITRWIELQPHDGAPPWVAPAPTGAPRHAATPRSRRDGAMTAAPLLDVAAAPDAPAPDAAASDAPPRPRRRWIVWGLVALGVAALGGGAFAWARARRAPAALHYLSGRVARGDLDETIRATGSVQPVLEVQVGAQVSGRVLRVAVDFNSQVRRGDLLAELDPTPYRSQVEQSRAALGITRASRAQGASNLTLAALTLDRARSLRAQGLNAQADVDQAVAQHGAARAAVALADAQIAQAQASLRNAETSLSYTRILAPIDGTVATRSIDPGQTVAASFQTPTLFVIANDLTHMRVMADVDEANIGKLRVGMSAEARVDAFPANVYRGAVSQLRITPTTTNGVVTYATVIAVGNPAGELRPGMTATITVSTRHRPAVLSVPNAALRYRPAAAPPAGGPAVYVLRGGAAARVAVTAGVTDGASTEVEAPTLRAGDEVVLDETDAAGARGASRMRMF